MPLYSLRGEADDTGWRFQLFRQPRLRLGKAPPVPFAEWPTVATSHAGVALLLSLIDGGEADAGEGDARLTHARAAMLTRAEATRLELPPAPALTLFLSHDVPIGEAAFRLRLEWRGADGYRLLAVQRQGTLLTAAGARYLVSDPLYRALDSLDQVNAATGDPTPEGLDRRMQAYAGLKAALGRVTGDLQANEYLRGLTIYCATGLGIDLEPASESAPFLPTLYGRRPEPDPSPDPVPDQAPDQPMAPDDAVPSEPLLPSHHGRKFQERFLGQGARAHYVLGDGGYGVYAVLDAPVVAALGVIAEVNGADAATRAAFRADPLSFLTPAIEAAGGDGRILCELRGYGDRVTGTGVWERPRFSFPLPVARDWFPDEELEVFTIALPDGPPLVVRTDEVPQLRDLVHAARAAGESWIDFKGQTVPIDEDLVKTVNGLIGQIETGGAPPTVAPDGPGATRTVLLTKDNEERLLYLRQQRTLAFAPAPDLPGTLKTAPLAHQRSGIDWLQRSYRAGAPGLLLADDMGLGKTYQVLAFLKWLRDGRGVGAQGPLLVVAPKTLIGNWQEELTLHLGDDALGPLLVAQDKGLRALRQVRRGNDIGLGQATLDRDRLAVAGLVLTSYETLRDYQLSFAQVRFAAIVYDEAQRLKNPASLIARAAKGQQGTFTLLLTGTPIENHVMDLWTLLDIAWPGFLGLSARAFLQRYREADGERRAELKRRLIEPTACADGSRVPPIMLRRFKQDVLDGLPSRTVAVSRETMPPAQQAAYDAVRTAVRQAPGGTLGALQQLRAVALHPRLKQPPVSAPEDAAFIADSARFRRLFAILDQVRDRREKALVFVDLREAQRALYDLIQRRYGLPAPRPEIINGATAAAVRDRIRREFQARSGFDVLLLGPRAAGLGLTLTAANHVIHLNRWWNPAVEDQCSDRVWRIGQTRPVTVHLPLAIHSILGDGSFDSLLHGLLEEKRGLSREIVVPVQFDDRDFRQLYERSLGDVASANASAAFDRLDWRAFEQEVVRILQGAGFQVDLTPGQGDGGVDAIATGASGRVLFVQCKHTGHGVAGRVDEQAILDLCRARDSLRHRYPQPRLLAVTNGRFSLAAENLAQERGVEIVDGMRLPQLSGIAAGLN